MQGVYLSIVNWARGTKATWKLERGNESLTLHFFKTRFQPFTHELILSLGAIQRNRKLQREKGAPVSYMVAQGGWGSRRVLAGASLAPELRRGPLPFLGSQRRSPGNWGKLFLLGKQLKRDQGAAALKDTPGGSQTLLMISHTCTDSFLVFKGHPRKSQPEIAPQTHSFALENKSISSLTRIDPRS